MTGLRNPAAFPRPATQADPGQEGMELRDYFAGLALHAHISAQTLDSTGQWIQENVEYAYKVADAMLAEREKP